MWSCFSFSLHQGSSSQIKDLRLACMFKSKTVFFKGYKMRQCQHRFYPSSSWKI